jgi:hypothetical protein
MAIADMRSAAQNIRFFQEKQTPRFIDIRTK